MPVFFLPEDVSFFPHPGLVDNDDGLLAIGGNLLPETLLLAYRFGIFPWYNPGELIHWYTPDPRSVLFPAEIHVSKSMRTYFNNNKYTWTLDKNFEEVLNACRSSGDRESVGTWISDEMKSAYMDLHKMSYAHSVEVWEKDKLVGGLYGVWLGQVFYGESMFSSANNASKFGLISFTKHFMSANKLVLIDCQVENAHLNSLGSRNIRVEAFMKLLRKYAWF